MIHSEKEAVQVMKEVQNRLDSLTDWYQSQGREMDYEWGWLDGIYLTLKEFMRCRMGVKS